VQYGWVNTPAAVFPLPPFFAVIGCGALSLPKKNFPVPLTAALMSASLSLGHLATGLLGEVSPTQLEITSRCEVLRANAKASEGGIPVAEWIVSPIVNYEVQMMSSNRSNNIGTTLIDGFHSFTGCAMFQDNLELFMLGLVIFAQ
jgi:hypothetical protein